MKASVIRIGNSKGVRLPKLILEQCGIEDEVELEIDNDRLIIRPARAPRSGWSEAFEEMSRRGDDSLLDEEQVSLWDESEWRW